MAEPTASITTGMVAASVGLAALLPGVNADSAIGAFAGATLFVVSAKDLSMAKRIFYLLISVVMGYYTGPELGIRLKIESVAVTSFICSALVVTLTLALIEKGKTIEFPKIGKGGSQ